MKFLTGLVAGILLAPIAATGFLFWHDPRYIGIAVIVMALGALK